MHTAVDLTQMDTDDLRLKACRYLVIFIIQQFWRDNPQLYPLVVSLNNYHLNFLYDEPYLKILPQFQCYYHISGTQYCELFVLDGTVCLLGDTYDGAR